METKTLITVLSILFFHWLFDFVFQTDKQAKGKSNNWKDLLSHTSIYSISWLLPICVLFGANFKTQTTEWYVLNSVAFAFITFVAHTITDYFTSRLNSKLWKEQKVHNFFVSIGFDQWLHYVQLLTTYYFLAK